MKAHNHVLHAAPADRDNLVEHASIQQFRDAGSALSRFTAAVYLADAESGKTLRSEKSTFDSEWLARAFIAEQGYSGGVSVFGPHVRDGNIHRATINLFNFGRSEEGFYITQGVGGYGRKQFESAAELSEFLELRLFDWPARKAEVLTAVGESPLEDMRYHLSKMDAFTLHSRAVQAGKSPARSASRAHLIDMNLCAAFPAYADQITTQAEHDAALAEQQCSVRLAPVIAEVKAGKQFPRIKVDQSFWYLDPLSSQVVHQDPAEHRRVIFDLEDRFNAQVVNLESQADFEFVVQAVLADAGV